MQSTKTRIVGVEFGPWDSSHLKHALLYFDELAVLDLENLKYNLTRHANTSDTQLWKEYEWLQEQGFIFDPDLPDTAQMELNADERKFANLESRFLLIRGCLLAREFSGSLSKAQDPESAAMRNTWDKAYEAMASMIEKTDALKFLADGKLSIENFPALEYARTACIARIKAAQLSRSRAIDAVATMPLDLHQSVAAMFIPEVGDFSKSSASTVEVVLRGIPTPSDETSWQEIIEFKADADSKYRFLALREWIRDVSRAAISPIELEEKLEYLLNEYESHMRLHRMKVRAGILQTIVVTTAEVVENALKLKFGTLAKKLFEIREKRIALLEAERAAPGRQVSYVLHARKTFGGASSQCKR